MEETYFGLTTRPFQTGLCTGCYYPATGHEHALARLVQAVREDEGLMLLTGAPGTGKTLLCHCLVRRLGPQVASALLTNSHVPDRTSLFQAILFDLALPYEGSREQELRLTLTHYLLNRYTAGRPTLLIVDEAQHLAPDLLEEIRLLSNLEGEQGRALQVMLVGQPGIVGVLEQPEMLGLRQRLAVRVHLEPLDVHEAADYLLHQVRVAGGRPEQLLAEEALEILARGTNGVPRLLNQAARQAFDLARSSGAASVDAEAALEALVILGLDGDSAEGGEEETTANAERSRESNLEILPGHARLLTAEEEPLSAAAAVSPLSQKARHPLSTTTCRPA